MCMLLMALAFVLQAPQAPPDTEIFLVPLNQKDGRIVLGTPLNITNTPGYDNQPSFTPDGRAILFTSARDASASTVGAQAAASLRRTDIYRYDLESKQVVRLTKTPEGEYSPTVTPDGRHFSVIRVEADGTQRLWQFTMDGSEPTRVLADVKPVGYHAWMDDHTLALFILGGDNAPATLQVADTKTGKAQVVATGIGRSVQRMPKGGISFVQREAQKEGGAPILVVKRLAAAGAAPETLVPAVSGASEADLAWMNDGTLLMANGGKLYGWRSGASDWTVVANLDELGLRGASRMAVSPGRNLLAIVAAGGPQPRPAQHRPRPD